MASLQSLHFVTSPEKKILYAERVEQGDAIILVDHGSRRPEANAQLEELANLLVERRPGWSIRCAHLEICAPHVADVVDGCVRDGARTIFLHPFFLLPGRHARDDLPRMAADARDRHPGITIHVTETVGLDPKLVEIVLDRIDEAVRPEPTPHES